MLKLNVDKFTVVGYEARTTNAREAAGGGPISQLWGRLSSGHFLSEIPHKVDSHIVAVYSDYESDKDGPYTYLLGAKVSSLRDIPAGMVARTIPAGTYALFAAEGGAPAEVVVSQWKRIWALEKPGPLHRAYKTDFEVYSTAPDSPVKTHVDVYIGIQDERHHH